LITRLVPSEPALVTPVCRNASISGHHVSTGGDQAFQLGQAGDGATAVELVEPAGDLAAIGAGAGQREQIK
jgi:hypothetical protein